MEEALAGNIEQAKTNLQALSIREKVPYDRQLLAIARALVEFQETPQTERASLFRKKIATDLGKQVAADSMAHVRGRVRLFVEHEVTVVDTAGTSAT